MSHVSRQKVYVAMSGGVDSSVAAALLLEEGYDVTGVYFKPWSPDSDLAHCDWKLDRLDAMKVAARLGISFNTYDFSEEYGKIVVKYLVSTYKKGLTPNPDVMCNKEIKFGLFLEKALADGANYVATGHYARKRTRKARGKVTHELLKGNDDIKDQSYFLWTLQQRELERILFPVGEYNKYQIRAIAKKLGLQTHNKKDSQGVCFIGTLEMKDFLSHYIKPKTGDVVDIQTGKVVGRHEGAFIFTPGQRHGLDIRDGDGPYFVESKDTRKNIVYVTRQKSKLERNSLTITSLSTTGIETFPNNIEIKIRYQSPTIKGRVLRQTKQSLDVKLLTHADSIAPGQSAVFYSNETLLGGGIIS